MVAWRVWVEASSVVSVVRVGAVTGLCGPGLCSRAGLLFGVALQEGNDRRRHTRSRDETPEEDERPVRHPEFDRQPGRVRHREERAVVFALRAT
jgi:hypothetical protein